MEDFESQENSVESSESNEAMEDLHAAVDTQRKEVYEEQEGPARDVARAYDAITIAAEMVAEDE